MYKNHNDLWMAEQRLYNYCKVLQLTSVFEIKLNSHCLLFLHLFKHDNYLTCFTCMHSDEGISEGQSQEEKLYSSNNNVP